ncbi:hypothetical protein PspLS_02119 [Pyricularia sp. CBS 133598]|nr:hypothetical protein PspLS_02119 [Pyricularia sp. CBS 133598]
MIVEREIKLVTEQHNIDKPPQMEGFPMKEWSVEIYLLDQNGKKVPAKCFTKAVYNLHPSFANPTQTFTEPPFRCSNEGWGEFEMTIDLYTTEKGGKQTVVHDLNFMKPTYDVTKTITFRNPSQHLQTLLRDSGPLPTDEDRKARKGADGGKKKKQWDLEKLASALTKLGEDDLIQVIQMIHDHRNDDTYVLNNPDAGEFSVDLYTMPDNLTKMLWEFIYAVKSVDDWATHNTATDAGATANSTAADASRGRESDVSTTVKEPESDSVEKNAADKTTTPIDNNINRASKTNTTTTAAADDDAYRARSRSPVTAKPKHNAPSSPATHSQTVPAARQQRNQQNPSSNSADHSSASPATSAQAPGPAGAGGQQPQQHRRVYQACIPCRRRKVRCDLGSVDNPHDPPCVRCRRESKECYFSATRRKRKADDEDLSGAEDDYVVRNGRKRVHEGSPPIDRRMYSDVPLTPGGSQGRTQPLMRPRHGSVGNDGKRAGRASGAGLNSQTDAPNTPLENMEARTLMRREVYGPHDALDLLYKAATDSPHKLGEAEANSRTSQTAAAASVNFRVPAVESAARPVPARDIGRRQSSFRDESRQSGSQQNRRTTARPEAPAADAPIDPQLTAKRDVTSDPGYTDALKAWARFRFVRAGWFTAHEAIEYIDYYYHYLSPLTPISPPTFKSPSTHLTLLTEEPILTVPGTGGRCRSQAIHEQLWTYLRGMIERVVWGQEAFGGGFCGSYTMGQEEAQTSSTAPWRGLRKGSLRTLGTIESLLILTEWHPRALHFPPAEAIDELMLPSLYDGPDPNMGPDGAAQRPSATTGVGGKRIESWLEPAWRSDRMCWMLLSTAMGLAYELGVFDDIEELLATGAIARPEYEDEAYRLRAHRIKRLVLVYLSQLAGRLGWTNMVPEHLRKSDSVLAPRRPASEGATPGTTLSAISGSFNYIPDLEMDDQIIHCWAGISHAMYMGNEKLFRSRKHTTDIIQSGRYIQLLEDFTPMLREWWRQFERYRLPPYIRHILTIEYEYVRIYINSLSLQAVVERCTNNASNAGHGNDQLSPQTQNYFGKLPLGHLGGFGVQDQDYVKEVVDGSRNLLRAVVDGLLPNDYLKHAPVRTYFRIISGAMFLLKTFALGAPRSDVEISIALMDRTVDALRNCVVDDVHLGIRFADLLETLTSRLRNRFIHAPTQTLNNHPIPGGSSTDRLSPQPRVDSGMADTNMGGMHGAHAISSHDVDTWLRPNGQGSLASLSAAAAAVANPHGLDRSTTPANISATPFEISAGNIPYPAGQASIFAPSTPAASGSMDHHHNPLPDNMFGDPSDWNNSSSEMWYLPTGPAFFQNMGDSAVAMTAEGVNVGGIDLLEYMAMDQFPIEGSGF